MSMYQAPVSDVGAPAVSPSGSSTRVLSELQYLVDYYASHGYFAHIQQACDDFLAKRPNNHIVAFWKAFAMSMQGNHTEAIRELHPLQGQKDISLACTAALITTHNQATHKDKEALGKLKKDLKEYSQTSNENELVFAARYFWHANRPKQARKCLDKALTKSKKNVTALTVYGWLNVNSGVARQEKKSVAFFETALSNSSGHSDDIGALMGRAYYHEKKQQFDKALDSLSRVLVNYPNFTPAFTEKSRLLLGMGNWDESKEVAADVLSHDPRNIDALRLIVLHDLCLVPSSPLDDPHSARILELHKAIERREPRNHKLFFDCSQLVARYSQRSPVILRLSLMMVERATQLSALNPTYITEQAYQLSLMGDFAKAGELYSEASKLDQSNIDALVGRIHCKALAGQLEQAEQELEFVASEQDFGTGSVTLGLLQSLLAWKRKGNEALAVRHLDGAVRAHQELLERSTTGLSYYLAYQPEMVMDIVAAYMRHIGTERRHPRDPPSPLMAKCVSTLEQLISTVPAYIRAQFTLAKLYYVDNDIEASERVVYNLLSKNADHAQTHILRAQLFLAREAFVSAEESLDRALSLNFEVRDTPLFQLLKARLLLLRGHQAQALQVLEYAMSIKGVRKASDNKPFPLQDRINLFLELASLYSAMNRMMEASRIMDEARSEFRTSSEVMRIVLADAELALRRGGVQNAIDLLTTVPEDNVYYTRAKLKMADIFLRYKKNKKAYAACYRDLAHKHQTVHNYVLLGDAYMSIQQPKEAIAAYETALQISPDDPTLTSQIGRALVTTHDYKRAVAYYEAAIKADQTKVQLFHELADLYLQLRQYDQALRVLDVALNSSSMEQKSNSKVSVSSKVSNVQTYLLMASVSEARKDMPGIEQSLQQAFKLQQAIVREMRSRGDVDMHHQQKLVLASVCFRLARFYEQHAHQPSKAHEYYAEALKEDEGNMDAMLALAKLHLAQDDLEQCEEMCKSLLKQQPHHNEATMMLADIMFRRKQHEEATHFFQQLLQRSPNEYAALEKLIELLRKAGQLEETPQFLRMAEKASNRALFDAGFHFCKGLFSWYTNDAKTALEHFNKARKDGHWGPRALVIMIKIYLKPDSSALFKDIMDSKTDNTEQLSSARDLLDELSSISGTASSEHTILQNYVMMATKEKHHINEAFQSFRAMSQSDKDHIPALLGMANAFYLLKNEQGAKNHLKRIMAKSSGDNALSEYTEEFHEAALMLAGIYIKKGKYDAAVKLCNRVKHANLSSAKAWELLGMIKEKEMAYRDAAEYYEKAWSFLNHNSAPIGFRLAFNYLKAERYIDTIDVCHIVLKQFPDYPKMKKAILDKARAQLRP